MLYICKENEKKIIFLCYIFLNYNYLMLVNVGTINLKVWVLMESSKSFSMKGYFVIKKKKATINQKLFTNHL